jgi:hypothetical protein
VPRGPVPSYTTAGGCSIFLPGKYTAAPNFGQHNYFASGIYYFDNVGNVNVSGIDLSGGNPGAEVTRVGTPACADDGDAGVSDGAGVEWILGGNSSISVTSASGTSFELFARQPAASLLEGAAGISIRSVPRAADAPAGYTPTLLPPGTNLFSIAGGSGTQVKVQGLVYSPNADIALSGTRAQKSELSGGVVASRLSFHPSDVGLGPDGIVSAVPTPAPSHQFFTISSTAQGGATKNVTTVAVIELGDGPNRSVVIDSWVTNAA